MTTTPVLPCPFCGERAFSDNGPPHLWFVECSNCGINGPIKNSELDSVSAWDTRAAITTAIAALESDMDEMRQTMAAAAEEIHAHWQAHCDAEGYGPANLQTRLEGRYGVNYPGYTLGAFQKLKAERDAALAAIAAAQAVPVQVREVAAMEIDLGLAKAICRSAGISLVSRDFIEKFAEFYSDWVKGDFTLPKLAKLDMLSCFEAWQAFDPELATPPAQAAQTDQTRDAFEAWFTRLPYGDPPPIEAWQAASKAATPPIQKVPLTDEQLSQIMEDVNFTYNPTLFARAIEAAHNITFATGTQETP